MKTKLFLIFFLLLLAFLTVFLVACDCNDNRDERVLDFKSMRDVELDVIISLGDSRKRAERLLGRPIAEWTEGRGIDDDTMYGLAFDNGMQILFKDDAVFDIEAGNELSSGRFEIYGYTIDMTLEQIEASFSEMAISNTELSDLYGITYYYQNFFDVDGNIMEDVSLVIPYGSFIDESGRVRIHEPYFTRDGVHVVNIVQWNDKFNNERIVLAVFFGNL